MPCKTYTSSDEYDIAEKNELIRNADSATRAACAAISLMEEKHPATYKQLPTEIKKWHKEHQRVDWDRKRLELTDKRDALKNTIDTILKLGGTPSNVQTKKLQHIRKQLAAHKKTDPNKGKYDGKRC